MLLILTGCTTIPSTAVPTSTARITATYLPTREQNQSNSEIVEESLVENDICELPCWRGLQPGKSDLLSVLRIMVGLEISRPSNELEGFDVYIFSLPPEQFIGSTSYTGFFADDKLYGQVIGLIPSIPSEEGHRLIDANYSLQAILSRYGVPSSVLIALRGSSADPGEGLAEYTLWIIYEPNGTAITYVGEHQLPAISEDIILVCPSLESTTFINLFLSEDASNTLSIIEFFSGGYLNLSNFLDSGQLKTWEEATGTSLDDFSELFKIQGRQNCFQSDKSLW